MSLTLRPASFVDDYPELIKILERNISGSQKGHFEWRHQANPAGEGWSWVACDADGKIAAMASVFPRNIWLDGKRIVCGQVGEFVVDAPYRSLGPAVMLQRATFRPVDSGDVAFCYDCPPHDRGMSTFLRLGMHANTEVVRYVLPLRSDEFLTKRLGDATWTKPIVAAANLVLMMRKFKTPANGIETAEVAPRFDDEFTQLDEQVPSSGVIRASRSKEDLVWRYCDNPAWQSRVVVARRAGELLGFITFIRFGERVSIVDLFCSPHSGAELPLLQAVIDMSRREKRVCVEAYCSDGSELSAFYEQAGFSRRSTAARVVAYAGKNQDLSSQLSSAVRWRFTQLEIML